MHTCLHAQHTHTHACSHTHARTLTHTHAHTYAHTHTHYIYKLHILHLQSGNKAVQQLIVEGNLTVTHLSYGNFTLWY